MSAYNPRYTYDQTVDGLCARVLTRLNDVEPGCEEERWSKELIRSVVCDAFWALSRLNRSLFSRKQKIRLTSGEACQTLPDGCDGAVEFLAVYDETGKRTIPVLEVPYESVRRNAHYPGCTHTRRKKRGGPLYGVSQYQIGRLNADARDFWVSPIPPAGSQLTATVRCTTIDDLFVQGTNPDLPAELRPYFPAVMELVMYTALSMDRDSANQVAMANVHLNTFAQLVNVATGRVAATVEAVRDGR